MSFNTIKVNDTDTNYTHSIFDISEYNSGATYADLSAALAAVPENKLHCGMTIRYVLTDDSKYVQYRYSGTSTSTANFINVINWQSLNVDDEPTAGSDNLVKSGKVFDELYNIEECDYTNIVQAVHINLETGALDSLRSSYKTIKVKTFSIEPDAIYYATGRTDADANYCSIAYYDENNNYLGHEKAGGVAATFYDYRLSIPNNAKTVKIQSNTNYITPSLKKAHNKIDDLKYKVLIKQEQDLTAQEISDVLTNLKLKDGNIITITRIDRNTNKVILLSDGSVVKPSSASSDAFIVDTFEISTISTDIIYLANGRITNNPIQCSIAYYDEDNNYLGYELQGKNSASNFSNYKLTVPQGTKYIKIWGNSNYNSPSLQYFIKGEIDNLHQDIEDINNTINNLKHYSLEGKNVAILGDSISTHGNSGQDPNAVEITITAEDVGQTLSAYITKEDVNARLTLGGTTYVVSDIGTEVTFIPTVEDIGKVIGIPKNYNANTLNVWWTYVKTFFECNIIPVCWSGAGLTRNRTSSNDYKASYAWHESQIRKCGIRTPGTMDRIAPDVIIITLGGNDWSHEPYAMLTDGYFDNYNVQYPDTDLRQDGKYGFKEAYFMTIGKLREAYPFAKIVLCTYPVLKRINYSHFPMNNGYHSEPQYNNAVREIANFCGCDVIEFDKCGITFENMYPTYISDSAVTPVHPNAKGHQVMGKYAIEVLKNINFDML